MPRLLSQDWVAAFNAAVADAEVPPPGEDAGLAARSGRFSVGQVVSGSPEGALSTVLHVDGGRVQMERVAPERAEGADVTMRLEYAVAAELAAGRLSPVEAVAGGRVRVRGDLSVLAAGQKVLTALAPRLAGLQAATTTE